MLLTPFETAVIMTASENTLVTTRQVYYRLNMYRVLGVKVGTAIITVAGIGAYSSIEAAVRKMVSYEKVFTPNPAHRTLYDNLFAVYKKIYPALKELYRDLQKATNYPEAKKING